MHKQQTGNFNVSISEQELRMFIRYAHELRTCVHSYCGCCVVGRPIEHFIEGVSETIHLHNDYICRYQRTLRRLRQLMMQSNRSKQMHLFYDQNKRIKEKKKTECCLLTKTLASHLQLVAALLRCCFVLRFAPSLGDRVIKIHFLWRLRWS